MDRVPSYVTAGGFEVLVYFPQANILKVKFKSNSIYYNLKEHKMLRNKFYKTPTLKSTNHC